MSLVVEPMAEVSSAAFSFMVPAGAAYDPADRSGAATVLSELLFRGAGPWDNRVLNEKLDALGLHRQGGVSSLHSTFAGALIGEKLLDVLELHCEILLHPHLEEDQFTSCKTLALQTLDSLEDDPRQKISLLTKEQFLSYPFGRCVLGKRKDIQQLSAEEMKAYWVECFNPDNTILAVAGKVDFDEIVKATEQYFGAWRGRACPELPEVTCQSNVFHEPNDGAQVHIGLMYPSLHYSHADYYKALTAVSVLSGGMGSRLFTEVREKRGLCYSVGAKHKIIGRQGAVYCYAGSSPDKAQEALDVMVAELVRLAEGISQDELDRAKAGLRASLIMQGESTSSRADSCAGDYYHIGRVRSLEEIDAAISSLTVDEMADFVKHNRPGNFTIATIGPKELKMPM
jgi:predicted Zn-dependent peptidase